MAPSGTRKARPKTRTRTRTKPRRRTHYKKQLVMKPKSIKGPSTMEALDLAPNSSSSSTTTCSKIEGLDFEGVDISTSACSTPKAQRFRIPEIVTCPPAPKKQRMISNCSSLQRTPIAFFAPPDLELFFYTLRDISV